MDYNIEICRRSCINELHAPGVERMEFFRHGGAYAFIKYEHNRHFGGAKILGTWSVPKHFDTVVGRFDRTVERFYDELGNPRSAVIAANVTEAINMASTTGKISCPWMLGCILPDHLAIEVAEQAFDAAKWHFGPIATSREPHTAAEFAAANAAMLRQLSSVRCDFERQMPRIFV